MTSEKIYIVMVGLPARGKSTIATRLKENLLHESVKTKIFNNGDLRRKRLRDNSSYADFFDPHNRKSVALREEIALINIKRAKKYLDERGSVAILDATNVSKIRRDMIQAHLNDHPILFLECINDKKEILDASILRKINLPEFGHLNEEEAIRSFKKRIKYYDSIYVPLKVERNYIKLDSLHNRIITEEIDRDIPFYEQIRDFLVTDTVKNLYLIRHGETYFNLENRIGGDSDLTAHGLGQAGALAEFFEKKTIPIIFTSAKKRTIQTAEPIKALQKNCTVIPLAEFNEIDSGVCECMSYEEIRDRMPEVYYERKKDKYNYVYPGGEGYLTMQDRIDRGIKKAL
ncbi:MAG: histidine phosphatase family protein, partial [Deltaproteobacteria bacterium]|nr:histidine phosphatase family protein [Deltaproteobacteria bacterium]